MIDDKCVKRVNRLSKDRLCDLSLVFPLESPYRNLFSGDSITKG